MNSFRDIENKASTLLTEYSLLSLPIDISKLAKALDIRIVEEDFEDNLAGLLYSKNGVYYIGLNENHHNNRKRFTVAHEIGHFVLHFPKDNEVIIDRKMFIFPRSDKLSSGTDKEKEANAFAASLLMPKSILLPFIKDKSYDLDDDLDIWKLSNALQVSEQALTYRLLNLNLINYKYE